MLYKHGDKFGYRIICAIFICFSHVIRKCVCLCGAPSTQYKHSCVAYNSRQSSAQNWMNTQNMHNSDTHTIHVCLWSTIAAYVWLCLIVYFGGYLNLYFVLVIFFWALPFLHTFKRLFLASSVGGWIALNISHQHFFLPLARLYSLLICRFSSIVLHMLRLHCITRKVSYVKSNFCASLHR